MQWRRLKIISTLLWEQIHGFEHVRYKKMFGEYMVYVNEKPILLICDNTVFVKKLDCIEEKMKEAVNRLSL